MGIFMTLIDRQLHFQILQLILIICRFPGLGHLILFRANSAVADGTTMIDRRIRCFTCCFSIVSGQRICYCLGFLVNNTKYLFIAAAGLLFTNQIMIFITIRIVAIQVGVLDRNLIFIILQCVQIKRILVIDRYLRSSLVVTYSIAPERICRFRTLFSLAIIQPDFFRTVLTGACSGQNNTTAIVRSGNVAAFAIDFHIVVFQIVAVLAIDSGSSRIFNQRRILNLSFFYSVHYLTVQCILQGKGFLRVICRQSP